MSIWYPTALTIVAAVGCLIYLSQPSRAANYGSAIGEGLVSLFVTLLTVIGLLVVWLAWALLR